MHTFSDDMSAANDLDTRMQVVSSALLLMKDRQCANTSLCDNNAFSPSPALDELRVDDDDDGDEDDDDDGDDKSLSLDG